MHLPVGSPCMLGRVSHALFVVWLAQSPSVRHWTQRLLGRSQTVLPELPPQVIVPHCVAQVLDMLHVAPGGQWVLSMHCTHRSAGNLEFPVGRVSQVLLVV